MSSPCPDKHTYVALHSHLKWAISYRIGRRIEREKVANIHGLWYEGAWWSEKWKCLGWILTLDLALLPLSCLNKPGIISTLENLEANPKPCLQFWQTVLRWHILLLSSLPVCIRSICFRAVIQTFSCAAVPYVSWNPQYFRIITFLHS